MQQKTFLLVAWLKKTKESNANPENHEYACPTGYGGAVQSQSKRVYESLIQGPFTMQICTLQIWSNVKKILCLANCPVFSTSLYNPLVPVKVCQPFPLNPTHHCFQLPLHFWVMSVVGGQNGCGLCTLLLNSVLLQNIPMFNAILLFSLNVSELGQVCHKTIMKRIQKRNYIAN